MRPLRWIAYTIVALLLASQASLALTSVYLNQTDRQMLVIIGGSMEPVYSVGDAVILDKDLSHIEDGDIVTFRESNDKLTTHRVVDIRDIDGTTYVQTQGDANDTPDPDMTPLDAIIGKPVHHIAHGGSVSMFLQSRTGRLLTFGPALLLVIASELLVALRPRRPDDTDATPTGEPGRGGRHLKTSPTP